MRNTRSVDASTRVTSDHASGTTKGSLAHLSDMDDVEIADGEPDITGWDVKSTNGAMIGTVEDLLVDPSSMQVRYIELKLETDLVRDADRRHALIPIGAARLDDDDDEVLISLTGDALTALPPYTRGTLSREYEQSLLQGFGRAAEPSADSPTVKDFYADDHFDEHRAFHGRRDRAGRASEDARYISRSSR